MTMTIETLMMIELDAARAPAPMLVHYIEVVRNSAQGACAEVAEHARGLLLKLDHLLRQQRIEPMTGAVSQEYLAPQLTLAEPVRAAA